jgi:hypothetical protein
MLELAFSPVFINVSRNSQIKLDLIILEYLLYLIYISRVYDMYYDPWTLSKIKLI